MNKINLENRVAIVTGGAQGFGLAITKRFIESGARVLIWDKDTEYLNKVDLKNIQKIEVDVSNYKSVENAFAESLTHENKMDILNLLIHLINKLILQFLFYRNILYTFH